MKMKKILSLLLSISVIASCICTFTAPVSAAVSELRVQDFSSLATAEDIKTALATLSPLYWNDADTGGTFETENRGDSNGIALKWNTTTSVGDGCWNYASIPVTPRDLSADDPIGTELWFSFDFKMDGTGVKRQFGFYNWAVGNWQTAPFFSVTQGSTTPAYKFNNAAAAPRQAKAVVDNGWHTLKVCLTKTGDAATKAAFILDEQSMCEADVASLLSFRKFIIWQGIEGTVTTPSSGSMSLDNFKSWVDTAPAAQEKVLYKIDTAAEWGTAADMSITDVAGSNGKSASDKVVRATPTAAGNLKTFIKTVNFSQAVAATDTEDVLLNFDMRTSDYERERFLMVMTKNSAGVASNVSFPVANGKVKYVSWHSTPTKNRNIMPIDQWNHYTIRFSKTKPTALFVNGVLENAINIYDGSVTGVSWYVTYAGTAAAGSYPSFSDEIDNYTVSLCPVSISDEKCTEVPRVYRNFDFAKVASGTGYTVTNASGVATAASDGVTYSGNLKSEENIVAGKLGKASTDKVLAYSGKNIAYTSVNYNNNAFAPNNLAEGSTLRGGVSVLYEKGSASNRNTFVQLKLNPQNMPSGVTIMAAPAVVLVPGGQVCYRTAGDEALIDTDKVVALNKWYRVEYVLNVGSDASGNAGTVDFYLDGEKLNDEPIVVDYYYASDESTPDQTVPVAKAIFEIEDQDNEGTFYIDDMTAEYIPEGLNSHSDIVKTAEFSASAVDAKMNNSGVVSLMDAADSDITVEQFKAMFNEDLSVIDASGAAAGNSVLASGNYAKLERDIWPDIYYMASDLNVNVADGKVSAYMPYSQDDTTALIIAVYQGGVLVDAIVDTSEDGILTEELSTEGANSYKVFLWKGINSLQPYYGSAGDNI